VILKFRVCLLERPSNYSLCLLACNVNGDVGGGEVSSEVRFCCIQSPRKLTIFYVKDFVPLEGNNFNNLFY